MTNTIKQRLLKGETVTATWLDMGSAEAADILVNAGWDVVVIDCEHGAAALEEGLGLIRAVQAAGGEAVLRVPDGSDTTLKRALDRGARSIIVPMVNTPDQARAIVQSCRYPGRGGRGYAAPIVRASGYGRWATYAQEAHDDLLLMVQCEHIETLPHLREIGAIDGVDMVFVGPNDLAASMGLLEQLEHPELARAKGEIETVCGEAGIGLGTILGGGRSWAALQDAGYRFIIGPNDVAMLFAAARAARNDMLSELAPTAPGTTAPAPTY
jgi:2-keto-3-deoxy-L-rhamnonate aldolase RhmA